MAWRWATLVGVGVCLCTPDLSARDGSLGVHNAAFAIQVLQKTYTAVGGNTFVIDFPNATAR